MLRVRFISLHFIHLKVGPLVGVICAAFAVNTEERDGSLSVTLVFALALERTSMPNFQMGTEEKRVRNPRLLEGVTIHFTH